MPQKKSQSLGGMLTGLLFGANLFTILILWACALSTYLPPDRFPKMSLMGLLFPVFLCADLAFLLVWLLTKARMAILPLLGAVLVGSFVMDYCPVNGKGRVDDSSLCVLSYNAGAVSGAEGRDSFWSYLDRMKPDIVCVQEVSSNWFDTDEARQDMKRLGLNCMGKGENYVLSHYPLHGSSLDFQYHTAGNGSFACWVMVDGDSVLVIGNHLESNRLSSEDKDEYRQIIHNPNRNTVRHEGRAIARKLAVAARMRGPQVDTLCQAVQRYAGYPMIVCGDFNDTPVSYTYRRLSSLLMSAYRQSGSGPGYSFNQDEFFVRIDHIFFSSHWQSTRTVIDRSVCLSDHYPIVSYLSRKRE